MFTYPRLSTLLLLHFVLFTTQGWAETSYVTDQFEITLRSGPSTTNNIVAMLKSGESLKVIEHDQQTKYSLVETAKGKQGYVLTRFLDKYPSGRDRYSRLEVTTKQLKNTITELKNELNNYKTLKSEDSDMIATLKASLSTTEDELTNLKTATHDTILILQQNDTLKTRINELESDKQQLTEENVRYKDSTAMDWFIRGASVSLIAFLLGIIVTRIRWKKRDSWSNY